MDYTCVPSVIYTTPEVASVGLSEEEAKKVLTEPEITLDIRLHDGDAAATAWGCDLTYDYVKINGDYRT